MDRPVRIAGTGSYLPERVLSNADLEKMVDTTDEWIVTRTGIRERRIASEKEATSDLSTAAAKRALKQAGVAAEDLDGIVVATMTPDMVMPNTGCLVQDRLGARKAACFGLEAACSGFTYGLEIGRQFVRSGAMDHVLVIGAEKLSSFTDWQDRSTCVLFGDGAGAAVLAPDQDGAGHRLITTVIGANGGLADLLKVPGGGSRRPASAETVHERQHFIKMAGREVFKYAVTEMCNAGRDALKRCGLTTEDVDWVVPHQANIRIIQAVAERLKVGLEKWYLNIDRCGNMSAASVAVAFDELVRSGRVQSGDILLMIVFGGGFTWGASVVQW
ncbi:MAG: ketoacyl-ACP synthase III [Kiritimatiellae bacterium]|nr:ketoacyl-ACP synthase III [Kiritimatiellia bacterium]